MSSTLLSKHSSSVTNNLMLVNRAFFYFNAVFTKEYNDYSKNISAKMKFIFNLLIASNIYIGFFKANFAFKL